MKKYKIFKLSKILKGVSILKEIDKIALFSFEKG